MSHAVGPRPTRFIDRPRVRAALGTFVIGSYLRFLLLTSRVVADPPDFWDRLQADWPAILTSWHGQSNLAYMVMPEPRFGILMSAHPDGQMMSAMARSLGYTVLSGSGASARQPTGTGGVAGFRAMLKTLAAGTSIFATGDIPPEPGRKVSAGIIAVARRSGRPVFAIATSSSRRKVLERVWDKMQLNFPFSRIGYAMEGPFYLTDPEVDDATYAAQLALSLDRVLARANELADGR